MRLIESEVVLSGKGDVIFKQRIELKSGEKPIWLDQNMSDVYPEDSDPMTAADALLSGIATIHNTDLTDIRRRLQKGETIYLVPPQEPANQQLPQ